MSVRGQAEYDATGRSFEMTGGKIRDFKVDSNKLLHELGGFTFNKDGSIKELENNKKYKQELIDGIWVISKRKNNDGKDIK